jgi:hypothetical protein
MGSRNRRLMCYKSPWGRGRVKRRPSTLAGGHGDGSSQAATILAATRPAERSIHNSRLQGHLALRVVAASPGGKRSEGFWNEVGRFSEKLCKILASPLPLAPQGSSVFPTLELTKCSRLRLPVARKELNQICPTRTYIVEIYPDLPRLHPTWR